MKSLIKCHGIATPIKISPNSILIIRIEVHQMKDQQRAILVIVSQIVEVNNVHAIQLEHRFASRILAVKPAFK
jgi:hypothetical protein